jgi:hypothetical protein
MDGGTNNNNNDDDNAYIINRFVHNRMPCVGL